VNLLLLLGFKIFCIYVIIYCHLVDKIIGKCDIYVGLNAVEVNCRHWIDVTTVIVTKSEINI